MDQGPDSSRGFAGAQGRGVGIVAVAAGLWGTDALFRRGLALSAPAVSVVFWEHAVISVLLATALWRRRGELTRLGRTEWLQVVLIGGGSSVLATTLFTQALSIGDPTPPLLLQKVQPLSALGLAALLLGERPARRLALFAVPALVGAWLVSQPEPGAVDLDSATAAALAVGAAALWAMGTVLGRGLSAVVEPTTLTALRLTVGLPVAAVVLAVVGGPVLPAADQVPGLLGLSLVPGLLALVLYYRGLRTAPASLATWAELAFPLVAIVVNRIAFDATLTTTQWLGVVLLAASVTGLSLVSRRRGPAAVGVRAQDLAPDSPSSAASPRALRGP